MMRKKLPAETLFALACSIGAAQTAEPVCTMSFLKGSVTESGNRPVTVFYVTDGARRRRRLPTALGYEGISNGVRDSCR